MGRWNNPLQEQYQGYLKGQVPAYKDTSDIGGNRTYNEIDPYLINKVVKIGSSRGWPKEFAAALMGGETTFGSPYAGKQYGPWNPTSYTWPGGEEEADKAIAQSPEAQQLAETIAEFKLQGMPQKDLDNMGKILYNRQVVPVESIRRSFDEVIPQKVATLRRLGKPVTLRNIAWLYQGAGVPNKYEVPRGRAYGKPVRKTSPTTEHSEVIMRVFNNLLKPGSKLGNYVRGIE